MPMPSDEPTTQPVFDRLERVLLELAEALPAALQELRALYEARPEAGSHIDVIDDHAADEVMTLDEAADYTGYSLGTVRAAAASGRLNSTQQEPHGRRRTTRADCDAWLQDSRLHPARRRKKTT
jgi:excisionase family DNA binding protein